MNLISKIEISKKMATLALTGAITFSLVGCGINETKSPQAEETEFTTEVTDTQIADNTLNQDENKSAIDKEFEKIDGSNAVEAAITIMTDTASSMVESTKEYKETDEYKAMKEQVKDNFNSLFNFVIGKGEINGYTIKDVSDKTVTMAKDALHFLDEYIESYIPEWKDKAKEKLETAGSWIWDKSTDIGAIVKEKGSEWLNEIEEKTVKKQR